MGFTEQNTDNSAHFNIDNVPSTAPLSSIMQSNDPCRFKHHKQWVIAFLPYATALWRPLNAHNEHAPERERAMGPTHGSICLGFIVCIHSLALVSWQLKQLNVQSGGVCEKSVKTGLLQPCPLLQSTLSTSLLYSSTQFMRHWLPAFVCSSFTVQYGCWNGFGTVVQTLTDHPSHWREKDLLH